MVSADANTMLRCIIGDDKNKIQEIRASQKILYTLEVIAEVVYVLIKVYNVPRPECSESIRRFLKLKILYVRMKKLHLGL